MLTRRTPCYNIFVEEKLQQNQQTEPNLQNCPVVPVQTTSNIQKNKITKRFKLCLIHLVAAIVVVGCFFTYKAFFVTPTVKSYEECLKAKGSIVQESYPQVCVTKNGIRFVQEVASTDPSITKTKAEECYEKATNVKCPDEGVSCMQTTPEETFCNCMGGSYELITDYGACVINGVEYKGIAYYELERGWYWGSPYGKKPGTPDSWVFCNAGTRSEGWYKPSPTETSDYLLEESEGSCVDDAQCQWAGEGCGGGHGVCTNNPEKYKDVVTTCDINENFPANRGYTCGCVVTLGKCGWKK